MSNPIKLHGIDEEFDSRSDAIRYLLQHGYSTKVIIQKTGCSHQHIHIAKKGILKDGGIVSDPNTK